MLSHRLSIKNKLFTLMSVNSGGYLPRRSVNIHHQPPPLRCIVVKYIVVYFIFVDLKFVTLMAKFIPINLLQSLTATLSSWSC